MKLPENRLHARTALIYSSDFSRNSLGEEHPFKLQRFRLAYELISSYGLTALPHAAILECQPVSDEALLTFHSPDYLQRLKDFSAIAEPRAIFVTVWAILTTRCFR